MKYIPIFIALICHLIMGQNTQEGSPYSLDNNILIESIKVEMPKLNIEQF